MNLKLKTLLCVLCVLCGGAIAFSSLTGCDKPAPSGAATTVKGLLGEGVDPHLYKPTRDDVAAMMNADAVLYSGLMLEGKMADALVKLGRDGKKVYAVTELIDEKSLMEPADQPGHPDPHVWMDVKAWI